MRTCSVAALLRSEANGLTSLGPSLFSGDRHSCVEAPVRGRGRFRRAWSAPPSAPHSDTSSPAVHRRRLEPIRRCVIGGSLRTTAPTHPEPYDLRRRPMQRRAPKPPPPPRGHRSPARVSSPAPCSDERRSCARPGTGTEPSKGTEADGMKKAPSRPVSAVRVGENHMLVTTAPSRRSRSSCRLVVAVEEVVVAGDARSGTRDAARVTAVGHRLEVEGPRERDERGLQVRSRRWLRLRVILLVVPCRTGVGAVRQVLDADRRAKPVGERVAGRHADAPPVLAVSPPCGLYRLRSKLLTSLKSPSVTVATTSKKWSKSATPRLTVRRAD